MINASSLSGLFFFYLLTEGGQPMPKIILRCNFLKDEPSEHLANYVKYVGTREGVEKIASGKALLPVTAKQKQLIVQIIKDIDGTKNMHEYDDYVLNPTRENASEFIRIALENNLDLIAKRKNYVDYVANRPRVEKLNEHGLFTDAGTPVMLSQVAEEVANHQGVIWTHVISLRREDAERLGYNTAAQWQSLIQSKRFMLSKNMKIDSSNLKWYAAFHNESHHPHIHLIVYSKNPSEGYLTKKSIEAMRSELAHAVFRQDFAQIYDRQNEARSMVKEDAKTIMEGLIDKLQAGVCENKITEDKILILSERLKKINGKKQYGYLNADVKGLVDQIMDELEKDGRVAQLYQKWYGEQYEILKTYTDTLPSPLPLSQQPAFKSIKNMVIAEALTIGEHRFTFEPDAEPDNVNAFPDAVEDAVESVEKVYQVAEETSPPDEPPDDLEPDRDRSEPPKFSVYHVIWSEQYKKAREYLYGSNTVDQNFVKAYQLFTEEAESGNALAIFDIGRMHHDGLGREINEETAQQCYAQALAAFRNVESKRPKPYVQYRIGKMYAAGQGTKQDYAQAAGWFQQAVAKNHKYAEYSLAGLYYSGKGVDQDYETAYSLYSKSVVQGNHYADYELGKMIRDGIGTAVDPENAALHFKRAFDGFVALEKDSRDDKLEYRIGQMLYTGTGTGKDVNAALRYFELSAKLGNTNAQYMVGKIYLDSGDTENVQKALEWLGRASENGNAMAQYALGKLYLKGEEIPRNVLLAVKWLTASSDQGNKFAQYALAKLYLTGEDAVENITKALDLLTKSALQKNQFAAYMLGKLFLAGGKAEKDIPSAVRWLTVSAEQDNEYATYRLGKLYLSGEDVPKDIGTALRWLTLSADKGNQYAQYALGKLYLTGHDVPQDKEAALKRLTASATQGNVYAQFLLDHIDSFGDPSVLLAATRLIHHLGNIFREDQNKHPAGQAAHIDRKRMRQLMQKKMAQGHAANDNEQQPKLNVR
jgi:TPR repeat protein